jgi:hypothetical protein
MADIFREIDEEVRRDKAAELWKKYGWVVTSLAVLAVLAVAGWQYWLHRENQASQAVGARLEAALKSSRDGDATQAETILKELSTTAPAGYRLIARFRLAAETAKRDAAAGATAFDALAADASLDQISPSCAPASCASIFLPMRRSRPRWNRWLPRRASGAIPPANSSESPRSRPISSRMPGAGSTRRLPIRRRRRPCASASSFISLWSVAAPSR